MGSFFGYGRWSAPIWFIGIEEAGGRSELELEKRLAVWSALGENELEDAPTFYPASGNQGWHGERGSIQATWKQLIRMLLLARGGSDDDRDILDYQRLHLGAATGDTCVVELLPLPSPDTTTWNYGIWSDIPHLNTRQSYLAEIFVPRAAALKKRCIFYRPSVVIFYGLELADGTSLLPAWSRIAGGWFDQAIERKKILLTRRNEHTTFFVTRHPVSESQEYFQEISSFLREEHGAQFLREL
jgi:hypothetical protein